MLRGLIPGDEVWVNHDFYLAGAAADPRGWENEALSADESSEDDEEEKKKNSKTII